MKAKLYRLFLALVLPPVLVGTVLFLNEAPNVITHVKEDPLAAAGHFVVGLLFFWLWGFIFCCIPGFFYWVGLETYWKNVTGPVSKARFTFLGAVLGTGCGICLVLLFGRVASVLAVLTIVSGTLAGFVTSLAIFRTRDVP